MAKRSQARRKTFQRQSYEETTFRDRKTRTGRRQEQDSANVVDLNARTHLHTAYAAPRAPAPLEARTPAQKRYIDAIRRHSLVFGIGPPVPARAIVPARLQHKRWRRGRSTGSS